MKVSEIINLCNEMSNLQLPPDCHNVFDSETVNENETAKRLITCCNAVLEDVYCNYCTAIATANVFAQNGFIDTSQMALARVLKLTTKRGFNVKYRYTANGLLTEDGEYVLTYAKLPPKVGWDSEVVLPGPRITERILAYGILAEYFFGIEDLQLAEAWQTRYLNALRVARLKTSSMTLPVGKWS